MKFFRSILPILLLTLYLGIYNGKLALYGEDREKPLEVFPYPVSSYPIADQKALGEGIPIKDGEELSRLLEAYLS